MNKQTYDEGRLPCVSSLYGKWSHNIKACDSEWRCGRDSLRGSYPIMYCSVRDDTFLQAMQFRMTVLTSLLAPMVWRVLPRMTRRRAISACNMERCLDRTSRCTTGSFPRRIIGCYREMERVELPSLPPTVRRPSELRMRLSDKRALVVLRYLSDISRLHSSFKYLS